MSEINLRKIEDAILDPGFWRKWNLQEGKDARKTIIDLMAENRELRLVNKKLTAENDYLRADNEFLKTT